MITFDRDSWRFTYRIAGVAIHDGRVLLHRGIDEDFWALPGGRCELGEISGEGLKREIMEELGLPVVVDRLLWVVENFFEYGGKDCHEMGMYHLMAFPDDSPVHKLGEEFPGIEGSYTLIYRWHRIDQLDSIPLYPEFLKNSLRALPAGIGHVVQRDIHDRNRPNV